MRILRVVSDLYPYSMGGIGLHASELSIHLERRGIHNTVYTCLESSNKEIFSHNLNDVEFFNSSFSIFGNKFALSMLPKLLKNADNFDLIHAHSHLFFTTILSSLIKNIKQVPLVLTNHGLISQTAPIIIQKIYLPTVAKWIFSIADNVICYTEEMISEMNDWGIPSQNISVIHNGIDVTVFKPDRNINSKEYDVIWVGRFVQGKGIKLFLNTIIQLKKKNNSIKILMIGDGPLRKSVEKEIDDMNLISNITFIKRISNNELPKLYNKSKVFVLTSLEEGVPRTILEAMACVLPVVCTNLPQIRDLVNNCGILINKKNILGYVAAIKRLLDDEGLRKDFGLNAYEKVVNYYSWEDTVNKTITLYRRLIE